MSPHISDGHTNGEPLEWIRTVISGMSHYIHIHCMVSLTHEAIQGWQLRYGFARLGMSMTRPRSMPNVMVRDTASQWNWLCGWDLWTHVCQVSLGIVDEVGASLLGRSIGPLWRFRHAQIHTGNL